MTKISVFQLTSAWHLRASQVIAIMAHRIHSRAIVRTYRISLHGCGVNRGVEEDEDKKLIFLSTLIWLTRFQTPETDLNTLNSFTSSWLSFCRLLFHSSSSFIVSSWKFVEELIDSSQLIAWKQLNESFVCTHRRRRSRHSATPRTKHIIKCSVFSVEWGSEPTSTQSFC